MKDLDLKGNAMRKAAGEKEDKLKAIEKKMQELLSKIAN